MNMYLAGAIWFVVCLALSLFFNRLGGKAFLIGVVGGALVAVLFTAGVDAIVDAHKPPACKTFYVGRC